MRICAARANIHVIRTLFQNTDITINLSYKMLFIVIYLIINSTFNPLNVSLLILLTLQYGILQRFLVHCTSSFHYNSMKYYTFERTYTMFIL